MTTYRVELFFSNPDENLYTKEPAIAVMEIRSESETQANFLAERLRRVLEADSYTLTW
jgi:hypothetical protein